MCDQLADVPCGVCIDSWRVDALIIILIWRCQDARIYSVFPIAHILVRSDVECISCLHGGVIIDTADSSAPLIGSLYSVQSSYFDCFPFGASQHLC
jgi:hypothetical protein